MRRIQRLAIPVVALSLFLVACGSDSDTASDETTVDTSAEVITDDTMVDDSASAKIDITALGLIKEGAITVCTDVLTPLGGLLLAATLIALNWSVGLVSARSPKVERWIEGVPVLLVTTA